MSTPPIRVSDLRRRYRLDYPLVLSLASGAFVGGALFLAFPETWGSSAIGDALPLAMERVWALVFLVGGALVLVSAHKIVHLPDGRYGPDARYQAAGLALMSACYATYFYALVAERDLGAVVIAAPVFVTLAGGCLLKAIVLRYQPKQRQPWRRRRR